MKPACAQNRGTAADLRSCVWDVWISSERLLSLCDMWNTCCARQWMTIAKCITLTCERCFCDVWKTSANDSLSGKLLTVPVNYRVSSCPIVRGKNSTHTSRLNSDSQGYPIKLTYFLSTKITSYVFQYTFGYGSVFENLTIAVLNTLFLQDCVST